jgi:hypothetical protein
MEMNANPAEMELLLIKQKIWEKFTSRLQRWHEAESRAVFPPLTLDDMTPDVLVIPKNGTLLFEPCSPQAGAWLRNRFRLTAEGTDGEAGILVHPNQQKQLVAELKAAGFAVAE